MKEKTKKKRQLILDSALAVFVRKGYEKTKIIDIAQMAGIGKGTVYEYFDSKEELFRCLLDEYCQLYKEDLKAMMAELKETTAREKLLAMMRMEKELKEKVHLSSLDPMQLQLEFTNFPGLKQAVWEMLQYKFKAVSEILQEGIDSGEFRKFNPYLAAAALMGACSTVGGLSDFRGEMPCGEVSPEVLAAGESLDGSADEKLLDLMIHGFGA